MTKNEVRKFLEENNIDYTEIKEGQMYNFYLHGYRDIISITCYYCNCDIIVKDEHDIAHYDCDKYLHMDFVDTFR